MSKTEIVKLFGERKIRSIWDDAVENWWFSVIDVIAVLTDSANPATYWRVLKKRLKAEGNETVTNCNALKLRSADGKMRLTDVATAEQLFRLIQSIPSPKAEPFKLWMAHVAAERLELERKTGQPVISPLNASDVGALDVEPGGQNPEI